MQMRCMKEGKKVSIKEERRTLKNEADMEQFFRELQNTWMYFLRKLKNWL